MLPLVLILAKFPKSTMLLGPLLALTVLGLMRLPPMFRGLYQKHILRHACGERSHFKTAMISLLLSCPVHRLQNLAGFRSLSIVFVEE